MQVHTFIAESAADAVAQIRSQLGPQAVVLNVRPLPGEGLSRLWQKRRIEVLACLPEMPASSLGPSSEVLADLKLEGSQIRQKVETNPTPAAVQTEAHSLTTAPAGLSGSENPFQPYPMPRTVLNGSDGWRVGPFLENSGLLPVHAARIVEELRDSHGDTPPASFGRELELARGLLRGLWLKGKAEPSLNSGTHLLVGAPGVGKTVCLCKWLAHSVLVQGSKAVVWRLDGRIANTAETLSVYSEILGAPLERSIPAGTSQPADELLLIDLPGVNWTDRSALDHLSEQIEPLPNPQIHLVLNAAYEVPLLLAQARAFSSLPIADLIVTHLDEEARWGKVWNLILGTNYSIRLLSAGQNIPGDWSEATPEQILAHQFPRK